MLKRILSIGLLLFVMSTALLACSGTENPENPDVITVDGLVFAPYNEEKTEYELIEMLDLREELTVPAEVLGKPVFSDQKNDKTSHRLGENICKRHTSQRTII